MCHYFVTCCAYSAEAYAWLQDAVKSDVQSRSHTLYTAPCNGVISHGAQIGVLLVFAAHIHKNKCIVVFAHCATFYACLSSRWDCSRCRWQTYSTDHIYFFYYGKNLKTPNLSPMWYKAILKFGVWLTLIFYRGSMKSKWRRRYLRYFRTHWQSSLSRRLHAFYTWINRVIECLYGAQCRSHGIGGWLKGCSAVMSTIVWMATQGFEEWCPTSTDLKFSYFTFFMTVLVKLQIEIWFFIELHRNSKLLKMPCMSTIIWAHRTDLYARRIC